MRIIKAFTCIVTLAGAPVVSAYDLVTHFDLSGAAFDKSTLGTTRVLDQWGLPSLPELRQYPSTPGEIAREFADVEPKCLRGVRMPVAQLIACGAMFEDVPGLRSFNHFFDPAHGGQPLTVLGVRPGSLLGKPNLPSPDWAIQDANPEPSHQEFAFKNAREYARSALTAATLQERETKWGRVFQAIGQVIHHLQDMAQPQHVRNDAHLDLGEEEIRVGSFIVSSPRRYERFTAREPAKTRVRSLAGEAQSVVSFPSQNSPFTHPRKFFVNGGKGIAEFTNRNFVSHGTNFRMTGGVARASLNYDLPVPSASVPEIRSMSELLNGEAPSNGILRVCNGSTDVCFVSFYGSDVTDALTGTAATNRRASTYSLFDQDLERFGATVQTVDVTTGQTYSTQKIFALNRFNFDAAHEFLIPRAVGYSAGLINYFFRGDIDLVYDEKTQGYFIANNGGESLQGAFELYYDGKNDTRHRIDQQDWGAVTVGSGQRVPVTVAFPDWNTAETPKDRDRYLLVFHGDMGEERASGGWEAVAAKVVDLSPFIVFKAAMGSEVRGVGGADFNMIVPSGYETRIRDLARSNIGGIVLTVNGQEFPAQYVTAPGAAGCWGTAECARIGGSFGVDGVWEFYLYRNNQLIAMNAGLVQPIVATEDFRDLYARPNASFVWICGFMNTVEASGLSLTRGPLTAGSAIIGLSLRDPADGSQLSVFEFMAHDRGVPANMFMTDVGMSAMRNIRVGQGVRPPSDTQWTPGRLACQVAEQL